MFCFRHVPTQIWCTCLSNEASIASSVFEIDEAQDGVQVVILSGCEYSICRAKAEGAFNWLVKPCTLSLVEATVRHAFECAMDELPA